LNSCTIENFHDDQKDFSQSFAKDAVFLDRRKFLVFIIITFFAFSSEFPVFSQFSDPPEMTEQYKYALGLIQRNLYDEATKVLKRMIADPSNFSKRDGVLYWQGECYYRLKKYREAIAHYEMLLEKFPQSPFFNKAAYGLGWAYAKDNNPKSAVEAFSRVESSDPKLFTDSRLKMGFLMVKYGMDPDSITSLYEDLLKRGQLTPPQLYEVNLQLGIQKFNRRDFSAAILNLEKAYQFADPEQKPSTAFYIAEALFRNKEYEAAAKEYEEILLASASAEIHDKSKYSLAWCRIKTGQPEAALGLLKTLATNSSAVNRREALRNLVDLLMNLHRYKEAIEWMEKAAELLGGEEAVDMAYIKGLALSRLGEFPDAILAFRNFLQAHPKNRRAEEARYQLALIYITMGKFEQALKELEPLHRRETPPEIREKALYRTGECYFNLGNLSSAKIFFERVLRDYPQGNARIDAIYQLGEVEYQRGNFVEAFNAFSTIGSGTGGIAGQATFRSGEVLMKASRYADAVQVFEDYLARFPEGDLREDCKFKLGICYLEMKDQGKALAAFSQLQDSKGYFRQEARFQIGEIAQSLGNFPLAIQQFKAIVAEEPKHPLASRARRSAGICLYKLKDFAGAAETFKGILKDYPNNDAAIPETRLWYGRSLIAQDKLEEGILEILKVPILFPRHPLVSEAYAEAARAYTSVGRTENAKKMWRELLKERNNGPLADEAREALKKL